MCFTPALELVKGNDETFIRPPTNVFNELDVLRDEWEVLPDQAGAGDKETFVSEWIMN